MQTECILWTGSVAPNGYGRRHQSYAHRLAWERVNGPLPAGLEVDHLCGVRLCVNPDHLEAVTPAENRRRQPNVQAQLARTHCPKGHPYAGHNLIVRRGRRECRACVYERNARNRAARKE